MCCFRSCCSLILLLNSLLISSILGFIINGVFIFYFKWFRYLGYCILFFILTQINFTISIICSIIILYRFFNLKKKNLELEEKNIKSRTIYSIVFTIISFLDGLLIFDNFAFYMGKLEIISEDSSQKPNIAFFILDMFVCVFSGFLWISLYNYKRDIKCCENYHNHCCVKNHQPKNSNNIIITLSTDNNNNFCSQTNVNTKEKEEVNHLNNYIEIFFFLTTGEKIKIIAPLFITIEKFINFFFEKLKINDSGRSNIFFVLSGEILDKNSNNLICNKFNKDIPILVIDLENIIHPIEYLFIYN